jgi:hypothetical protein
LQAKYNELAGTTLNDAARATLLADLWQLENRPTMTRMAGPFSD